LLRGAIKHLARDSGIGRVQRLGHLLEDIDVLVARSASLISALLRTRPLGTAAPTSILVKTSVHTGPPPESAARLAAGRLRGCVISGLPYGSVFRRRRILKLRTCLVALAVASTTIVGVVAVAGSASADDARLSDILSGWQPGKCIDVDRAQNANGTPIQLWACNGTAAQRWRWQGDTVFSAFDGKCLDVAGGSRSDGALVQLYQCNDTGAQQWLPDPTGRLVNPQSGKCLDVQGWGSTNGTRLQIWTCTEGINQVWWSNGIPNLPRWYWVLMRQVN